MAVSPTMKFHAVAPDTPGLARVRPENPPRLSRVGPPNPASERGERGVQRRTRRAAKHSCPLTSRPSPCCPGTAKPRSSIAAVRVRSRPGNAAPGVPPGRFDPVALVRDHYQRAARLQKTAQMIGFIEAQRQAVRLSPLDPNNQDWKRVLSLGLMLAGRHDEVMEWIDESLNERPNHLGTIHCKLTLCGYFGRVDEGRAWARRLLEANPAMTIAGFEAYGAKFLVPGDIRFGLRVSVGPGCLKDDDLDQSPCRSPRRGCRWHSAGVGACQPGTPGYAANHGIWRGPMSDCDSTTSTVAGWVMPSYPQRL
jgi:hypothetical protein